MEERVPPGEKRYAAESALASEAAQEAGRLLARRFQDPGWVRRKSDHDLVTALDLSAEALIIGRIREAFPGDAILAEESRPRQGDAAAALGGLRTWLIDPLDGSVNYAHGIPFFCVSIALAEEGRSVLGIVHDPLRGELFTARRGGGAWLGELPLGLSEPGSLLDLLVAVEVPERGVTRRLARLRPAVRSVRETGSAALALAYVACGRFGAFWEQTGLAPWDVAAAGLIVEEAGGHVTEPGGGPWLSLAHPRRHSLGLLAAAPARHLELMELLSGHRGGALGAPYVSPRARAAR